MNELMEIDDEAQFISDDYAFQLKSYGYNIVYNDSGFECTNVDENFMQIATEIMNGLLNPYRLNEGQ